MKTVIISQARMTSTRLPGKVLKRVLNKPLLEYHIERLLRVKYADEVIIATTINKADDPIIELCKQLNVPYFRGPEEDVLKRYFDAAKQAKADVVVRVTSDCPLIDPRILDKVIKYYLENREKCDYASNTLKRTYPRGMDTEVFSFKVLKEINDLATEKSDREHVTLYIYKNPWRYSLKNLAYHDDKSCYRLTVDTIEDFKLIKKILEALYPVKPYFTMEDCIELLEKNPAWKEINAHIKQKQV